MSLTIAHSPISALRQISAMNEVGVSPAAEPDAPAGPLEVGPGPAGDVNAALDQALARERQQLAAEGDHRPAPSGGHAFPYYAHSVRA